MPRCVIDRSMSALKLKATHDFEAIRKDSSGVGEILQPEERAWLKWQMGSRVGPEESAALQFPSRKSPTPFNTSAWVGETSSMREKTSIFPS